MSVLLRQPRGFEGLRMIQVAGYSDSLPESDGPDVVDDHLHGCTATAPRGEEPGSYEDVVSQILKFQRFPAELSEGIAHLCEPAAETFVAVEGPGIEQFRNWSQIDVRVQVLEDRLFASLFEGVMASPDDLHVLLRNTPSPSPQNGYFMGRV